MDLLAHSGGANLAAQYAARYPKNVSKLALIGPEDKIKHDLEAWRDSVITTMLISGDEAHIRRVAELVLD